MKSLPDIVVEGHEPSAVVLFVAFERNGRMARSAMARIVSSVTRMAFMVLTAQSGRPGHDCRPFGRDVEAEPLLEGARHGTPHGVSLPAGGGDQFIEGRALGALQHCDHLGLFGSLRSLGLWALQLIASRAWLASTLPGCFGLTPRASSPAAVMTSVTPDRRGLAPDGIAAADIGIDFFKQALGDEGLDHLVSCPPLSRGGKGSASMAGRLAAALSTIRCVSESLVMVDGSFGPV